MFIVIIIVLFLLSYYCCYYYHYLFIIIIIKGYYASIIDAFQPNIPIYIRWGKTNILTAYYLSIDKKNKKIIQKENKNEIIIMNINNKKYKCFENLYRKFYSCTQCLQYALNPITVHKFKNSAYKLINNNNNNNYNDNINIVLAYRSKFSRRHINNINLLISMLSEAFNDNNNNTNNNNIKFRACPIPDSNFSVQVELVANTQILITDHGIVVVIIFVVVVAFGIIIYIYRSL